MPVRTSSLLVALLPLALAAPTFAQDAPRAQEPPPAAQQDVQREAGPREVGTPPQEDGQSQGDAPQGREP